MSSTVLLFISHKFILWTPILRFNKKTIHTLSLLLSQSFFTTSGISTSVKWRTAQTRQNVDFIQACIGNKKVVRFSAIHGSKNIFTQKKITGFCALKLPTHDHPQAPCPTSVQLWKALNNWGSRCP